MTNNVKYFASFLFGTAVGVAVSWKILKTKYEQIAQEEIDSVKEVFSKRNKETAEFLNDAAKTLSEIKEEIDEGPYEKSEGIIDYSGMCRDFGYISENKEKKGGDDMNDYPYVISPDEFDEIGYNTVSLTYYADGVLTDERNDPIEDVDEIIGEDSLNHFGEYEDDSVFVRNDALRTDYEILRDLRNYYDIVGSSPMVNVDEN